MEMEDFYFKELTNQPTVVHKPAEKKQATVVRKPAVKRRREYRSQSATHNLRATMDLGAAMRLRGPEHKFVLVGGSTGYNVSDVCWALDTPDDGFFWKCFAEVPKDMRQQYGYSVCAIDSKSFVMAGGGSNSSCALGCFKYSVKSGVWEKLRDTTVARCSAGLVCLNKVLYFLGGEGNRNALLKSCEKMDLKLSGPRQRWIRCANMAQPMVFPHAAAAGDSVYVVSNTHHDNKIKPGTPLTLQCYDPRKDRWNYAANLPSGIRDTFGASVLGDGGFVYLVGGWEKLCARYDVNTDAWTMLKRCPSVHSFAGVCIAGGKINVFGGNDEQGLTSSCEEYDVEKDEWRTRTLEMPENICHHHALVLYM